MTARRGQPFGIPSIGTPGPALARLHLATMGAPDDAAKIACHAHGFLPAQSIDLDLKVLRHELADNDRFSEQPCRHHALSEIGRKGFRTRHDAERISRGISVFEAEELPP